MQWLTADRKALERERLADVRRRLIVAEAAPPKQKFGHTRQFDPELADCFYVGAVVHRDGGYYFRYTTRCQEFDIDGSPCGDPFELTDEQEVPHFTSSADAAMHLKHSFLVQSRLLRIQEEDDEFSPLWKAQLIDAAGEITGAAESYEFATAVVLALLEDLIEHGDVWSRIDAGC